MAYRQKDYTYNPNLNSDENLLLDKLFKLKLSHMAEELERQLLNPNSELLVKLFYIIILSTVNICLSIIIMHK
ncbi:hypothetical protein SAMN02910369_01363 [Lachnospiraceae bacterium NE2001]|nr:hypothetical protein SAMN02910369_01363 [Lachnospiraceae bacterium NE2001]